MNDAQIKQILETSHTIATVGCSTNPAKPSHTIPRYLKQHGYRVIPVNPSASEILGEKSYPDLLSIPDKVDVVQLFRPSDQVLPFVQQAIEIGAKVVWMQEGISNQAAARLAEAAGLQVVMDRCMMVAHQTLMRG